MMTMSEIPDKCVKELEKDFEKFIWNGHRPKIPLKTLKLSVKNGGCNLVDVKLKDRSLKIIWKRLIESDKKFANLVYDAIDPALGKDIWECDMDENTIRNFFSQIPDIWKNVLKVWNEIKDIPLDSFLWYNKNILIGGKEVFYTDCYKKGLKYLSQFYNEGKELKSAEEMKEEFGLDIMRYNGLIAAASKSDKELAKTIRTPDHQQEGVWFEAKYAYAKINNASANLDEKWKRWKKECAVQEIEMMDLEIFKELFMRTKSLSSVPKYQSFYFRLLHRAIVTNIQLKYWKLRECDKCSWCEGDREHTIHLFVTCVETAKLWKEVRMLCEQCDGGLNWEPINILFCRVHENPRKVQNMLCLITLQYIYRQRCIKKTLCVQELRCIIQQAKKIEKYIAIRDNSVRKYNLKWCQNESDNPAISLSIE